VNIGDSREEEILKNSIDHPNPSILEVEFEGVR